MTYSKIMFYVGVDGQLGLSGYNGSAWAALTKGTLEVDSAITAGGTNPVNSAAVIAYINSLDASSTSY